MKERLQRKNNQLLAKLGIETQKTSEEVNYIIRTKLHEFVDDCKNPAIWCLGKHTRMLMADFMNELKKVRYIIDNNLKTENSGFHIIDENEVVENHIDGIIISSYDYKEEIKTVIEKKYPQIKYLDIYEELDKKGIYLRSGYFSTEHPYSRYKVLNQLQNMVRHENDTEKNIAIYRLIVKEYIVIKDFKTAMEYANIIVTLTKDEDDKKIFRLIEEIYQIQKEMIQEISQNNVLMLCIDGLRRQDILNGKMPLLLKWLQEETYFYENAYSTSTSTYESLIPTYSENNDLRTKYYEQNEIPLGKCRFITEALKQQRKIFFYTDTDRYVECDDIVRKGYSQTVTEKMWDFVMDAYGVDNGLFYVHILYESHYSYPNPYTENKIVADGSSIMFDFLDSKGGKLRTDYVIQQGDALRYLDDVLMPLLTLIKARIVLYADHGNILLTENNSIEEIDKTKFTFHEDLIQIPLAVKAPEFGKGIDKKLISLMKLTPIIRCLMNQKEYNYQGEEYIKVLRSSIYNPDFIYLYKKCNYQKGLQAFELFIFSSGYKLAVYADGSMELFLYESQIDDEILCRKLYRDVRQDITVC